MSERERKTIESWKRDLRESKQVQPQVTPEQSRIIAQSFRRLLQERRERRSS